MKNEPVFGPQSHVILPSSRRHAVRYAVVPFEAVLTSHRPRFEPAFHLEANAGYPARLQHRMYSGPRALKTLEGLERMLTHFEADRLTDLGRGSELGPPLVSRLVGSNSESWLCIAGNLRLILLQLATFRAFRGLDHARGTAALSAYARCLAEAAENLRIDLAGGSKHGVLVRELVDFSLSGDADTDRGVLRSLSEINRHSDAAFTRSKDIASVGYTYARGLLDAVEDGIASGFVRGISRRAREVLTNLQESVFEPGAYTARRPRWAADLLRSLSEMGVIPESDANLLFHSTSDRVTDIGTRYARHIVSSLAFDDPDLLDAVPGFLVQRLLHVAPQLIRLRGLDSWDLRSAMAEGARLLSRNGMQRHLCDAVNLRKHLRASPGDVAPEWFEKMLPSFGLPESKAHLNLLFDLVDPAWNRGADEPAERLARGWAAILMFGAGRSTDLFRGSLERWLDLAPTQPGGQTRFGSADFEDDRTPPSISTMFGGGLPCLERWLDEVLPPSSGPLRNERQIEGADTLDETRTALAHAWNRGPEALFFAAKEAWPSLVGETWSDLHPRGRRGYPSGHSLAQWFGYVVVRQVSWHANCQVTLPGQPSERQLRRTLRSLRQLDEGRLWPLLCNAVPALQEPIRRGRRSARQE